MNPDHDPIDALLRSGSRAYPQAATPDAARLRHVVTTARRRDRRARGTVLACASALVAGGAALTVRTDGSAGSGGEEAALSAASAPTTAASGQGGSVELPSQLVDTYCDSLSVSWSYGGPTAVVWFEEGASPPYALELDGATILEAGVPDPQAPVPEDLGAGTPDGGPSTSGPVGMEAVDLPEDPVLAGVFSTDVEGGIALIFDEVDQPQPQTLVLRQGADELSAAEIVAGSAVLVAADGSIRTAPLDELDARCDDDPGRPDGSDDASDPVATDGTVATTVPGPDASTPSGGGDEIVPATTVPDGAAPDASAPDATVPATTVPGDGDEPVPTTAPAVPACEAPEGDGAGSAAMWLSNQSYADESIDIEVSVDGDVVFAGSLETGDQHQWSQVEVPLGAGSHELVITSPEFDEPLTASIEPGNGVSFGYFTAGENPDATPLLTVHPDCSTVAFL